MSFNLFLYCTHGKALPIHSGLTLRVHLVTNTRPKLEEARHIRIAPDVFSPSQSR